MSEPKHTPLPFGLPIEAVVGGADGFWQLRDAKGEPIARALQKAEAIFLATAANSYYGLLEACERVNALALDPSDMHARRVAFEQLRAEIAKAKGES